MTGYDEVNREGLLAKMKRDCLEFEQNFMALWRHGNRLDPVHSDVLETIE